MAYYTSKISSKLPLTSTATPYDDAPPTIRPSIYFFLFFFLFFLLFLKAFDAGTKQARGIIESYANIDMVKPFFNVEPVDIRNRLVGSLRQVKTPD